MRNLKIFTTLILLSLSSCKNKNDNLSLSFYRINESLYKLKISNTSLKNYFLFLPSLYVKKSGCPSIYSLTSSGNLIEENFFCSGETFTAQVLERGLFSFDKLVHPQYTKCKELASKVAVRWKSKIEFLCSDSYGPQNVYFTQAGGALDISFKMIANFPSGKYEVFTNKWDIKSTRVNQNFERLNNDLKRIIISGDYSFFDTKLFENKKVIGHFEVK